MQKLTGIKAFEACWQSLKGNYSISAYESRLLMQAMGRLVDNYATQEEIVATLPHSLQELFGHLVNAYLNGFWLKQAAYTGSKVSPAMIAAAQRRQRQQPLQPTAASEAATYIIKEKIRCFV